MRIDEAGHQRASFGIDDGGAIRCRYRLGDLADLVALDQHAPALNEPSLAGVQDVCVGDQNRAHRVRLLREGRGGHRQTQHRASESIGKNSRGIRIRELPRDRQGLVKGFRMQNFSSNETTSYNHRRYHESLDNCTPADVYYGRHQQVLSERSKIKKLTMEKRKKAYRRGPAQVRRCSDPAGD